MPKRKRHRDDYDHLSHKLRKIQRKLEQREKRSHSRSRSYGRRSRRSRTPSSYSETEMSSRNASPSPRERTGELEFEYSAKSPSPVDDGILSELPSVENRPISSSITHDRQNDTQPPNQDNCNNIQLTDSNSTQNLPISSDTTADQVPSGEKPFDNELLEILGEDPSAKPEFGKELHQELANRLEHIATSGLSKEIRKELYDKYLIPSNCTRITAPQLNLEIKAALPELTLKRDKGIETRQKQLASAITCLGQVITSEMQMKDKNNQLLKSLMDAVRILCDVQHMDSRKRRYFACSALKKDINEQLVSTKIDKFLFGENLAETLKAAKAVSKSGAEIKVDASNVNKNFKKTAQPQPSASKNLNWRAPPPPRKPPTAMGPPRSRQPAPARKHDNSSRASRYHSKPTRRQ